MEKVVTKNANYPGGAVAPNYVGLPLNGGPAGGVGDAGPGAEAAGAQKKNGASGDNVVDATFEEVKDDKKK